MPSIHKIARAAIRWVGGREPLVLAALLIIVGGTWVFIKTAEEVLEGETRAFDEWLVKAMRRPEDLGRPIGPAWLAEAGRDVTALGGVTVLTFFTVAVGGFLWLDRKRHMLAFFLGATLTGVLGGALLKRLFRRPRPTLVPHLSEVFTTSFPSGHSMMATLVYMTLGVILASAVRRRAMKVYALSLAMLLSAAVGASRVLLGVHYPTDVLAGWAAGLSWALVCWLIARRLQRRGVLESERQASPVACEPRPK